MDVVITAGKLATYILGALMFRLALSELQDWIPILARRIVNRASERLPEPQQSRYREEWLAHLEEYPGKLSKALHAFGCLIASGNIAKEFGVFSARRREQIIAPWLCVSIILMTLSFFATWSGSTMLSWNLSSYSAFFVCILNQCMSLFICWIILYNRHVYVSFFKPAMAEAKSEPCRYNDWMDKLSLGLLLCYLCCISLYTVFCQFIFLVYTLAVKHHTDFGLPSEIARKAITLLMYGNFEALLALTLSLLIEISLFVSVIMVIKFISQSPNPILTPRVAAFGGLIGP